jgi:hypothetical protein
LETQIVTNIPSWAEDFPEYLLPDSKFSIAALPPKDNCKTQGGVRDASGRESVSPYY